MWAEVTVAAQMRGRRIECAGAWIAATAIRYDLPLVTRNREDYLGVTGLSAFPRLIRAGSDSGRGVISHISLGR